LILAARKDLRSSFDVIFLFLSAVPKFHQLAEHLDGTFFSPEGLKI
jgi:hypothetical protein